MRTLAMVCLGAAVSVPLQALAQSPGCAALIQAGADAVAAQTAAEDRVLRQPRSVRELTCLDDFFSGGGLNILTNMTDFSSLMSNLGGQFCAAVRNVWQSEIGSAQCGLTVSGFDLGFGRGGGGGAFCPSLNIGGGGSALFNAGASASGGVGRGTGSGVYVNGRQQLPAGYGR